MKLLVKFEIKFLNFSGFKPRIDSCVHCCGHITEKTRFSYVLGGLLCSKCFSVDGAAQNIMNGTIATINYIENIELEKIKNFRIVNSVGKELSRLLRNFIDFHMGGQFKSLEFLKKVRFSYV